MLREAGKFTVRRLASGRSHEFVVGRFEEIAVARRVVAYMILHDQSMQTCLRWAERGNSDWLMNLIMRAVAVAKRPMS